MNLIEKVFGTHSERELKMIRPIVTKIESLRPEMMAMSDEELRDQTRIFRERLADGATLDDVLPEAFATVREAARRTLNMEHFPVQLIGGIVLHQGRIAEMRTGEGKTLVSTCPAYLNALKGKGVQIVTVNDYLAKRDAEWMGQVHQFLGLTVGVVLNDMNSDDRRKAYACDITYVTNNELGFDYLRDNMSIYKEQLVLRDLDYCIIDEVDSVLIDEARTPLIISGQSGKSTKLYEVCDILARQLEKGTVSKEFSKIDAIMGEDVEETGDFVVDEKDKVVNLTEDGVKKVRVLSGGEKVRCMLSKMMISGANVLLLDEPTDHLDMESIDALNRGMIKFSGVMIFSSRDHQIVQTTANRIMEIVSGKLIDKITTYDEYLDSDEMARKRFTFTITESEEADD